MNWNPLDWMRGRGKDSKQDTSGATLECAHSWVVDETETDHLDMDAARIVEGHLVIPTLTHCDWYCEYCDTDFFDVKTWSRSLWEVEYGDEIAIPIDYMIDSDLSTRDALGSISADYAVDTDGDVTTISGEDEGRILVNKNDPVKAGGATD